MLPSSITDACNVSAQTGLTLRAPDMQEGFMAGEDGPRFEIPADMRALAEKSVEQAKQAFDIFISAAQHAVNTAETQAVNAHAGAKEMGELAIGFAERNIASSFAFAQKLLQAKEPKDVVELHTDYVNSQIATLTDQAKELSKRAAKMGGQDTQH
jgi:phasin